MNRTTKFTLAKDQGQYLWLQCKAMADDFYKDLIDAGPEALKINKIMSSYVSLHYELEFDMHGIDDMTIEFIGYTDMNNIGYWSGLKEFQNYYIPMEDLCDMNDAVWNPASVNHFITILTDFLQTNGVNATIRLGETKKVEDEMIETINNPGFFRRILNKLF